jgi:hypothetical protein
MSLAGIANCRNTLRRLFCGKGIVVTGAVRQTGLRGRGEGRDRLVTAHRLHPGALIGQQNPGGDAVGDAQGAVLRCGGIFHTSTIRAIFQNDIYATLY